MNTEFPNWLQDQMDAHEWNQSQLAYKAGVSRGAINNILNGLRMPGIELCTAIARALDLPPTYVMRLAGILEEIPTIEAARKEILDYKYAELSPQQQDEVLKFIDFLHQRDSEPVNQNNKHRQGSHPGELIKG